MGVNNATFKIFDKNELCNYFKEGNAQITLVKSKPELLITAETPQCKPENLVTIVAHQGLL